IAALVAALGSELDILLHVDIDEITRAGGGELGEAIARLRAGQVHRRPGYDGEYGVIRLRDPAAPISTVDTLFEVPVRSAAAGPAPVPRSRDTAEPPAKAAGSRSRPSRRRTPEPP